MKFLQIRDPIVLSVILLIKIVSWFSSPLPKKFFVKSFALANYQFSRNKRRSIEKNLSEVLDERLSENLKREIIRRVFHEFWEEKFSLLPSRKERAAIQRVDIRGVEHLQGALENGRGVILWESNSFGKRAFSKQVLHEKGFSIHQVHSDNHFEGFLNPHPSGTWVQHHIINRLLEKFQKQFVSEIIYLPGSASLAFTKVLLDRLKQNAIVCISGDAKAGQKKIPVKFLGHINLFPTGMVSLAKISGASILPIFCIPEENRKKILIVERPIDIDKKVDRERSFEITVSQYISLLESYIRRYPENFKSWDLLSKLNEY